MIQAKSSKSKHWDTMVNILDGCFPKGKCQERGRALILISYIQMMLDGQVFDKDGKPEKKQLK